MRNNEGDVLWTVDVKGDKTTFDYSEERGADGKRIINGVKDATGTQYRTDDNGKTWYNADTNEYKDPLDQVSVSVNRENGQITYDSLFTKSTVNLDGTKVIEDKFNGTEQVYNKDQKVISSTDAEGNSFKFEYDKEGNLVRATVPEINGQPGKVLVTEGPPKEGEELAKNRKVDWTGAVSYERANGEKQVYAGDGSQRTYDQSGKLTKSVDANNVTSEYTYNGNDVASVKRTTASAEQTITRNADGTATLVTKPVITNAEGKPEVSSDASQQVSTNLADFNVSKNGDLTLNYKRSTNPEDANKTFTETFKTDGSRTQVRQDNSYREFDSSNRM
ncbi:MAG: RHS repeat domain-containing protein, partial [Cyanobacteriota/Melainabacteria group bacterium]